MPIRYFKLGIAGPQIWVIALLKFKYLSSIPSTLNLLNELSRTLLVVLFGCETRSLTLREEHRLGCLKTGCQDVGDWIILGWIL
jgi:hypothetical protein